MPEQTELICPTCRGSRWLPDCLDPETCSGCDDCRPCPDCNPNGEE